ncbi:hypothetical protein TrVE_jg845 [Triparma verrucosa]|uniref:Fatty acid desaturase domain-containing protein n=1 Tax=Triparma verrucosa TaxID=1606542 RepID=A0A9W7CCI8_9STRA|nr:hypothetical protein TrVE_jg845 [Triparma verrucosa]
MDFNGRTFWKHPTGKGLKVKVPVAGESLPQGPQNAPHNPIALNQYHVSPSFPIVPPSTLECLRTKIRSFLGGQGPRSSPLSASKMGKTPSSSYSTSALLPPSTKMSSGVSFQTQGRHWRIGRTWYDFSTFDHPGGSEILYLARDRFSDSTYAFESHHMDQEKARKIIKKYAVGEELQKELERLNPTPAPKLTKPGDFYYDLRLRVLVMFREKSSKAGNSRGKKVNVGPTPLCLNLFYASFLVWVFAVYNTLYVNPSVVSAVFQGVAGAVLGAFGHNWIHQPKYKFYALLSLDTIGFSSTGWYREHILQHHMYTNTPLDNHFRGTDPFLITDPTVPRNFFQKYVTPILNPVILTFGLWGNYGFHLGEVLKGNEPVSIGKLFLPTLVYLFYSTSGVYGLGLFWLNTATTSIYYFTMALMNHNSENTLNVKTRNEAKDWGEAQISSCADWSIQGKFLPSIIYLWLNYHCVHHLFPLTDFSHHRDIQGILMETCRDHGVEYVAGEFWTIYKEMVESFSSPRSLFMEINCYNGS